jgi:hypothetical protein
MINQLTTPMAQVKCVLTHSLTTYGSIENLKPILTPKERTFLLLIALNPIHWMISTAKQPALPFLISGLGYLASKLRKNLLPLFL